MTNDGNERRGSHSGPRRPSVAVAIVGIALTAVLVWVASTVNHNSDNRLLQIQVKQATSTISTAVPSLQAKLEDALQVVATTNSPGTFKTFVSGSTSIASGFSSLSLWKRTTHSARLLTYVGTRPQLLADGEASDFYSRVHPSAELQVTGILAGQKPRIGFAELPPNGGRYIVYAESAFAPSRRFVVPKSSPFNDLNFALYLGSTPRPSQLIEASAPTPIQGPSATSTLPFGNTAITVVATPATQLAGGFSAAFSWIILGVGLALTLASAGVVQFVAGRREVAEDLAHQNESLYVEQRAISETLQRSFLPRALPSIPGVELAARYIPGTTGVEVGGDWYSVIEVDEQRFAFVVGDVSGRGLIPATIMASLRYTIRAYASLGYEPAAILEMTARELHIGTDGHFATVLVGTVDRDKRELTMASVGHFNPLIVRGHEYKFATTPIGVPLGIGAHVYESKTISLPPNTTLVAFTDGLIERRTEAIDSGLERLRKAAAVDVPSVDALLTSLIDNLVHDDIEDDSAILGIRWLN